MGILKFIFSALLVLGLLLPSFSQDERRHGLRLGFDLSRLALPLMEGGRSGLEFSADMDMSRNFYIAAEVGYQNVDLSTVSYNYSSLGNYGRVGIDYNFLKNLSDNQYEMVFGGARIGYASLHHSAFGIDITPNYWGKQYTTSVGETKVNTVWFEVVGGIKAELFKNFFVGWSVRGRLRLYQFDDPVMEPIYVPGYGRGENRANLGMTYSIFYRLPLMKFKPKPELQ